MTTSQTWDPTLNVAEPQCVAGRLRPVNQWGRNLTLTCRAFAPALATHGWLNSCVIIQPTTHVDFCAQLSVTAHTCAIRTLPLRAVKWILASQTDRRLSAKQRTCPLIINTPSRSVVYWTTKVSRKKLLHGHKRCDKRELPRVIKSTAGRQDTQGVIGRLTDSELPRAFLFNLGAAHVLWLRDQ